LYLLGDKIPAGIDGRILTDFFEPEFLQSHPVQAEEPSAATPAKKEGSPYNTKEAAQVEERLKALGYID
jgi:hypothetical protein